MHWIALLILALYVIAGAAVIAVGGLYLLGEAIINAFSNLSKKHSSSPSISDSSTYWADREAIKQYSEDRKQFIELLKERHSVFDEADICQGAIDKIKAMPGDYEAKSGYVLYWSNRKKKAQKERIGNQNNTGKTLELAKEAAFEHMPGQIQSDGKSLEELNKYLKTQRWHADQARMVWGLDVEEALCNQALVKIRQASSISDDDKQKFISYWEKRLDYLRSCKKQGGSPSRVQTSYPLEQNANDDSECTQDDDTAAHVDLHKEQRDKQYIDKQLDHNKEAIELEKVSALVGILQSVESSKKAREESNVQAEELSKAIQNNTVSKDLLKPDADKPSKLHGYDDWKQDVIDYVAAVHLAGQFKNRYSAMQSAIFVANKIILEFLASDGNTDFFSFVLKRCDEMPFSTPSEKLVYDLNGEIAKMLASGAKEGEIKRHIENKLSNSEKGNRPRPEDIYPLESTGNADIDSFARLAKAVSHIRLKHLNISDEEIDEGLGVAGKKYNKREWKTFEDYFSNAFQFGYLTERRFQRLYTILYNIAKAKQDGLSNTEIIRQVGDLYVIDEKKNKQTIEAKKVAPQSNDDDRANDIIPYRSFTKEEHSIIAVASRVTRELYHHRLFKRTARIAIDFINKYHKLPPAEVLPEKQYITLSAALLKREDSLMSTVYDTIVHITDCIFSGKSEEDTFNELKERELKTFVESGTISGNKGKKQIVSVAHSAYLDLKGAVVASEIPSDKMDLMPLAEHLNDLCNRNYSTKAQYYKAMLALINQNGARSFQQQEIKVMKYILLCKVNDAPNVSFRALVGSKFPELYRKQAPKSRKR